MMWIGILYTETFTNYLLFISLNFAGFFGKREIIVMLIIVYVIAQHFALFYVFMLFSPFPECSEAPLGERRVFIPLSERHSAVQIWLQSYCFFSDICKYFTRFGRFLSLGHLSVLCRSSLGWRSKGRTRENYSFILLFCVLEREVYFYCNCSINTGFQSILSG